MRFYGSFGWGDKIMGLSLLVGEEVKHDLVGYGYDNAPTLTYLKIHLLFFEIVIGNLSNFKNNKRP